MNFDLPKVTLKQVALLVEFNGELKLMIIHQGSVRNHDDSSVNI